MRQGLALAELDDGPGAPLDDRRDPAAVDGRPLGEVEPAEDRLDVEADHVVGEDLGDEVEDRPEPPELDRDDGRAAGDRRALRDRERELAADQEPGRLAVEGHQVRLGQDLGQAIVAQGVDEQREMAGVEDARRASRRLPSCPVALKVGRRAG